MKWILLLVVVLFDPVLDRELHQAVILEVLDSADACETLRKEVQVGMKSAYPGDTSFKIDCVHQDEFDAHHNKKETQHESGKSQS